MKADASVREGMELSGNNKAVYTAFLEKQSLIRARHQVRRNLKTDAALNLGQQKRDINSVFQHTV